MSRILIVDDKEQNLYYLQALLTGHGHTVESARHGAEALVLGRRNPPDLIIADLLMPVMDGYTLLRHWKADPQLKQVPFVVYTATYTEAEDERLALNLGADAFILKPAAPEDFLARIREVQDNATADVPNAPRHPVGSESTLLKVYSETLIRKLEGKTLELEEANRTLERDIANRKQTEAALRESEQRFRQLAENISEVFWITDPAKREMLYISPAYEKIWGRTCAELYASPGLWMEAIHAEDRERVMHAALSRQLQGNYDETYRIVRPDGSVRWVRDRAYPVANEQGEFYRIVGTAEDITERKKLETQFLRAQRMESIGTLAGGIAHDLNNILAPILMSVGLLKDEVTSEIGREMLATVHSNSQRGAELVRQVLSFARGVEGRRILVNPVHLIHDIQKIVRETFPKDITFTIQTDPDPWTVTGDPTQLHQVFMNLCVNARDAMPHGGALKVSIKNVVVDEVYAGMNPDSQPGAYAMITFEDSGIGIPSGIRDRIFEPFFTTKETGKGTGLGLSITLGIVRSHEGFINVYSEGGKGTKFKIYLPANTSSHAIEAVVVKQTQLPRGQNELVLVVDDEESIRSIARRTLERFGYRVVLASNGAEAVACYASRRHEIAVVLTDMAMPVMDGPATIIALKAVNADVKIVGSSGLASNGGVAKAVDAGVHHFIPKPYTADRMLTTLAQILRG